MRAVFVLVSARARLRRRRCSAASWSGGSRRTGRAASPAGPSSGSAASPTTPRPPSSASSTPAGIVRTHRCLLPSSIPASLWDCMTCYAVPSLIFAHVLYLRGWASHGNTIISKGLILSYSKRTRWGNMAHVYSEDQPLFLDIISKRFCINLCLLKSSFYSLFISRRFVYNFLGIVSPCASLNNHFEN